MNLEFIKPQNLSSLLMKSSQSNFNLRLPGSYLVRSYLITTVLVELGSNTFLWALPVRRYCISIHRNDDSIDWYILLRTTAFPQTIEAAQRSSETKVNVGYAMVFLTCWGLKSKDFNQKSTVFKWNCCILWIDIAWGLRKLC